jgi:hypothetical protein
MPLGTRRLASLVTGLWILAAGLAAVPAGAETMTLTAVASVFGAAPFYSDVRAFNTSYEAALTVTADYRCFIGACAPSIRTFTLAPRESRAFDDICVSLFAEPGTAGAVEFSHSGASGDLVVSSRLYSTYPMPTVGMYVPALTPSSAFPVTLLTSIRNGGAGAGFRTNVGVYNPGVTSVSPTFRVYDGATLVGATQLDAPLPPHAGAQLNDIFMRVGAASLSTSNASVVVDGNGSNALFSYAAVIDNATTDPIFVVGAEDRAAPTGPQTVSIGVRAWNFSPGGPVSAPLTLKVGTTYTLIFHNTDAPGTPNAQHGFSGISDLGLPSTDNISAGHDFVISSFTPQPYQRGTYPFVCTQNNCGGDPEQHNGMIGLLIIE